MKYIKTEKDVVAMGSGDLYLIEAKDFDMRKIPDVSNMVNIGYIKDSATFTIETERLTIATANRGIVARPTVDAKTTFDTNIISYVPENVARFLTGYNTETEDGYITTYQDREADSPYVALVFCCKDKDSGKDAYFVMPKCQFDGDIELAFSKDEPVSLNYHFEGLSVTLPDGSTGSFYTSEPIANDNANLEALTMGVVRLSPSFSANVVNYTAETSNATNTITAIAEDSEATIVIKHGNNTVTNGAAITWTAGVNTVTVTVTSGETTKVYTITVTKS